MPMDEKLETALMEIKAKNGKITVLTGAGISAESGIPTFRGPEGYWTVGSDNYRPEEMATRRMFTRYPYEVWQWYLFRRGVCAAAEPNRGHLAIVELEKAYGDRFVLITQNVDGLHLRAGNSMERTFQIHGNIFFMRCWKECTSQIYPIPQGVPHKKKEEKITAGEKELLQCPTCGDLARPHVLWFDESYNEEHFKFESSIQAASSTDLLIVIGTSGATNLPMQVGMIALQWGAMVIDINPNENPFSSMAKRSRRGFYIPSSASEGLNDLNRVLLA
jgi:NAD-dependent deacetylase